MKHILGAITTAVVLMCAPATALAQGGPAGRWELAMTTPQGVTRVGLLLTLTGDTLSGQVSSPMGSMPVTGTATGNDVTLSATVALQGMSLTFDIAAKVDGDAIAGTVKVGDLGQFPFTGTRAAEPDQTAAVPPSSAAPITDLNGRWDIKLVIAGMGEMPATALMKQEGEKLTGTISSPAGELTLAGTVTGKAVHIDFEAPTPQGTLPVTLTGDIGETSVTGKASVAGLGEAEWTATRSAVQ